MSDPTPLSQIRAAAGRKGGLARHARHPEQSAEAMAIGRELGWEISHRKGPKMSHKTPPETPGNSLPDGQKTENHWKQNTPELGSKTGQSWEAKHPRAGKQNQQTDTPVTPPAIKNPPQERLPTLPFGELPDYFPQKDSLKAFPLHKLSENLAEKSAIGYTAQNVIQIWVDAHRENFEADPLLTGRERGAAKKIATDAALPLAELKAAMLVCWSDPWHKKHTLTLAKVFTHLAELHKLARESSSQGESAAEFAARIHGFEVIAGGQT